MNQFPDPNRWLVSFGFFFFVVKFMDFFFLYKPSRLVFFDCIIVSLIFYFRGAEGECSSPHCSPSQGIQRWLKQVKGPYWQDSASPGSLMLTSRAAHAWLALESRAGSLLQSQDQAKCVDSALPVSRCLVGGSTLQSVRKFSVTFLLTSSFFKTNIKLSVQKNRLSCYLVKEMGFSWKL